jgi:phage shock protein A
MTLIQRLARLLKADLHGILDGLEDPEEVVKQTIRDMEEAIATKEHTLAVLHTAWQHLATKAQEIERRAQEIEQRLEVCFQEGNDTLARTFIRQRLETTQQARRVARAIEESQTRRVDLEHTIAEQRAQLATIVQQLHSFAEVHQRHTGMAAPFTPAGQDATITEDDIEGAFLQEKHRRAAQAQTQSA